MSQVSVLVGENTRIHSQLLAEALGQDHTLAVTCAVISTGEFLVYANRQRPDVVVYSAAIETEPAQSLTVLRQFHALHPETPSVVLLESSKHELVVEAFRSGARGVFSKNESLAQLRKCIRSVHEGQVWANSEEVRAVLSALAATPSIRALDANGMDLLSAREREVVQYLAEGLTNREIGERLKLSQHTVKNYLLRIFDKLGVSSRVELLRRTLCYRPGDGAVSLKNGEPSSEWLRKAAERGVAYAQLLLAEQCAQNGAEQHDPAEAYFWYCLLEKTAPATFNESLRRKQKLTTALTARQIDEAHLKVKSWLAARALSPRPAGSDTSRATRAACGD
jgi:DNA-binding NarL/FixJ family response regulator